jgi:hypothetical protein
LLFAFLREGAEASEIVFMARFPVSRMHLTSPEGGRISLFYSAGQIYFTGEPFFRMVALLY